MAVFVCKTKNSPGPMYFLFQSRKIMQEDVHGVKLSNFWASVICVVAMEECFQDLMSFRTP